MAQPAADEAGLLDDVVFHAQEELQLVAAQRIVALRLAVGVVHGVEIARALAVVENRFLIKVVYH